MFHTEEDLLVFGARGDALPLVRIEGRGRNTLHGLWTDGSVQPTFLDTCALCTRISRH